MNRLQVWILKNADWDDHMPLAVYSTKELAEDGLEAVQAVQEGRYDLILMDLQMPGMDGFESAAAIRQLPGYQKIPILALTANYSDTVRRQCQQFGMQGFLSKPVQSAELWSVISQNLS